MRRKPTDSNVPLPTNNLQIVNPIDIYHRIADEGTFIVNIVTAWCSDCTERQSLHINGFVKKVNLHDIDVLQVNVQQLKGKFVSTDHEEMTMLFGGPGYPRTVLIKNGNIVDQNNVEFINEDTLSELAEKFIRITSE